MTSSKEIISREREPRPETLNIRRLGLQPYEPVWKRMQRFTESRSQHTPDEIWMLEHERVFTQGMGGRAEHILAPGDIPVVPVDRGGQVTYHGPGQLVAYLLIDLKRRKLGIRTLVTIMERALVETLQTFGVTAGTRKGAPGVYVGESKIASLGLRVQRGCSFHGLALNVDMDLEPFLRINPCGYRGLAVTQLKSLVPSADVGRVEKLLTERLAGGLGYDAVKRFRGWGRREGWQERIFILG